MKKLRFKFIVFALLLIVLNQGEYLMSIQVNQEHVCDLGTIYQKGGYNYSVPKSFVESWLHGVGFGRNVAYTNEEQSRVDQDAASIFSKMMAESPYLAKVAYITCGAPGAGKTVLLEQIKVKEEATIGQKLAYIDPDAVCLKNMPLTFGADVVKAENLDLEGQIQARKQAYNDWRPASNGINHLILGHLIKGGYAFCFGTTATGDKTYVGFEALKKEGYRIHLIHVTAPDQVRVASIQERDKVFIQTTEEDIKEKAKLLPQRISDTYLKYADQIDFYYRDKVNEDAKLSAVWLRGDGQPTLEVNDEIGYQKIKEWHNANLDGNADLLWEKTVEATQTEL